MSYVRWEAYARGLLTVSEAVPYPKAMRLYPTVRQSLLSAYDLCALESHFEIAYGKGWSTHPQARGRTFHKAAARMLEDMHRQGERKIEVDVALAILHEALRQEDVDRVCPMCGSEKIRRGAREGFRECANGHRFESDFVNIPLAEVKDLYWVVKKFAYDNEWDTENLVDVEKRLEATVRYSVEGVGVDRVLTGQLDAFFVEGEWDDHGIVVDYKDTWGMPAPTELSFEGFFQQRFYALLVMDNYPSIQRVTLREFYVRFSEPREATIYREALDDIRDEMSALVQRFDRSVQTNVWPPTPGKQCSYCLRPTACPIPKFVRGAGRIDSAAEAEKRAKQLLVATAIVKQNTEALSAWAREHGAVPIRDAKGVRVWGHRESKRTMRPDKTEIEAMLAMTGGKLDRSDLDRLYREDVVSRFEAHVPKPERVTDGDAEWIAQLGEAVADAKARNT